MGLTQLRIDSRRLLVVLAGGLAVLVAVWPLAATAKGGRPEVRVAGSCANGATSSLRLRDAGDGIDVRFELDHGRADVVWRVVLVHERRIAWKGTATTTRPGGSFEVRRTLADLPGADMVTASAWGPRGIACRAVATLPDS